MNAAQVNELDQLLSAVAQGDPSAIEDASNRVRAMALADLTSALEFSARFVDAAPRQSAALVRALAARAHALCYANDFSTAVQHLTQARQLAEQGGFASELGPLWLTQVQPLARLGRLADAEHAARQARQSFLAVGALVPAAKAGVNLAIVLRMMGRPREALEFFDQAFPELGSDPLACGMVHSNRAEALLDLDRFDDAATAFESALQLLTHDNHDHAAAVVEGNLADLLSRRGDIDESLPRFDSASARFLRVGAAADAARLLAEEAEALLTAGAYRKSLRLFDRSIPVLRESKLTRETARACLGAGVVALKLGDLASADALLSEAIATAEACGAASLLAEARLALAESALALRRLEDAHALAVAAMMGAEDRPMFRARVIATIAGIATAAADHEQAGRFVQEGLQLAHELRAAPLASRFHHLHAQLLHAQGLLPAATAEYRAAIDAAERRRSAIRAEQLRTAYLDSAEQLYMDAVSAMLDANASSDIDAALGVVELIKARTLLESPQTQFADQAAAADFAECLSQLNSLYSRLGPNVSQSAQQQAKVYERLTELEARLDRLHDRRTASSTAANPIAGSMHAVEHVRTRLSSGTFAIVYFSDRESISAVIVSAERTRLFRDLASRREVAQLARRISFDVDRALTSPSAPAAVRDSSLQKLADLLVRPLVESLGSVQRLSIVPCKDLHGLPLTAAALLAAPTMTSISLSPGLGVGLRLASLPSTGTCRALIIGVSDELAPHAEQEARDIARLWPGATLLEGAHATAERVMEALAEADLVHFAGHGVFDHDFPMSSRLRLGDRWVTAREVTGRLKPGVAVFLSGCDTGQSAGGGEDRYGLTRACLSSGASMVVGAQWRLHDAFARDAFAEIHTRLASSGSAAPTAIGHALTQLQRSLAAKNSSWPLWAGLYAKGAIS